MEVLLLTRTSLISQSSSNVGEMKLSTAKFTSPWRFLGACIVLPVLSIQFQPYLHVQGSFTNMLIVTPMPT